MTWIIETWYIMNFNFFNSNSFWNSNLFQTIAVILTWLFVFVLYKYQKSNEKESTIKMILMDIKESEDNLKKIDLVERRFDNLHDIVRLKNWDNNKYNLVNDLSETDFDIINNFFWSYNAWVAEIENYQQTMIDIFYKTNDIYKTNIYEVVKKNFNTPGDIDKTELDIKNIKNCYDKYAVTQEYWLLMKPSKKFNTDVRVSWTSAYENLLKIWNRSWFRKIFWFSINIFTIK